MNNLLETAKRIVKENYSVANCGIFDSRNPKRYKRLYEELLNQAQPIIFAEPHKIDTLRFEKCYPDELLRNSPNASAYILKDIAQGLAEGLNKYIVYRIDHNPEMNTYHICGEIKVVNR